MQAPLAPNPASHNHFHHWSNPANKIGGDRNGESVEKHGESVEKHGESVEKHGGTVERNGESVKKNGEGEASFAV